MLVAIVSAIVTLVVIAVILIAVFALRNRTKSSNVSIKKDVRSINSVGVASSLGDAGGHVGASTPDSSGAAKRPVASPAGNLKSRFVAMGVLTAAIFGTLTAKLWSMQIISAETYKRQADENQYATVYHPAPRGIIYDAGGVPLVKNRPSLTIVADAEVADDRDVVQRLSAVLGIPHNVVRQRIQDATAGAQSQRVVASDVRMRDAAFIVEHADAFKGVNLEQRTTRDYPFGALAAHVVGYTGPVTKEILERVSKVEGRDVQLGDVVGLAGVEYQYDNLLAGAHGESKVVTNANGDVVDVASETQSTKGSDAHLTIKGPLQYVCDKALADLIAPKEGVIGTGKGVGGAIVVMDVRDGGIAALASYPTFSPLTFTGRIPDDVWDAYRQDEAYKPLLDRAIGGRYPAASTYKSFTGLAALNYGFADTARTWDCDGSWDGFNTGREQKCWNHSGHGTLNFRSGIVESCDIVFYDIAKQFFDQSPQSGAQNPAVGDTALQDYLKQFRFDEATGIDLPAETWGVIPTPEWKADHFKDKPEEGVWQGGDLVNMIIGQGYVLVTPIEMAVAYGCLATGKLLKPHVLKEVRNVNGEVVWAHEAEVVAEPDIDPTHLGVLRDALNGVATDNAGIASLLREHGLDPAKVACKTGTAEYVDKGDTAWFACYAPVDDPQYVAVCVVEHGGGGSAVAAPLGAEILAAALAYEDGTLTDMGAVAGSTGKSLKDADAAKSTGRTD